MHLLFGNQANYANNEIKQKIKQKNFLGNTCSRNNVGIYMILTSIE